MAADWGLRGMTTVEPDVATQPAGGNTDEHHIVDPRTLDQPFSMPDPDSWQTSLCGVRFRIEGYEVDPHNPPVDVCRTCVEVMWRQEGWS